MTPLIATFHEQIPHCTALGSPFMARLLGLLAQRWPQGLALQPQLDQFSGDIGPKGHSLPLRICGGLHALSLSGQAQDLAACYPPHQTSDDQLWEQVEIALRGYPQFWPDWLTLPPQTNEVRRASGLILAACLLQSRYPLPLRLSELGASAGLNLMFDQFHLHANGQDYGPASKVMLTPDVTGTLPSPMPLHVSERRGVDLNPLDPQDPQAQMRLLSYLWADQSDRLDRTRAAISLANAPVDQCDAIDWLTQRLSHQSDQLHMIYSTVAWQYFPAQAQARGTALIEEAGAQAGPDSPLAWVQLEADGNTRGAALTLRLWPGDLRLTLGRMDFHGRWIDWSGPSALS